MTKISVAMIAQAKNDIERLRKPLGSVMLSEPVSHAHEAASITAAFQRLELLVKDLMGAEVTVRG